MRVGLVLGFVLLGGQSMGCAHSRAISATPANLADAVAQAKAGDIIRVAAGTYYFSKPLELHAKGTQSAPIRFEAEGVERPVFDFSLEVEERNQYGVAVTGDWWQITGIEAIHAGSYGIFITGNHNRLEHCITRENRSTGTHLDKPASYNLVVNCDSFRNFDPKSQGENADGFAAKHEVGPGNVFRGCRSYQNSDDGWDFWMAPHPILIEDCVAFHNGYNIWHVPDFQGDGNGYKFGGNYVATNHICRRCVSIENPLNGFDQNHNIGSLTIEDCVAIRCGKGFSFPELPRAGQNVLRRNTSFGCQNVLETHMIAQNNHWYPDIPAGNLGPPPRPGHRDIAGAGAVPTTQEAPLIVPANAPKSGIPADAIAPAPPSTMHAADASNHGQ